jgi:Transposase DDE domain
MRNYRDDLLSARKDRMTMVRRPDLQQALQFVLTDSATEHGATSGWQQRRGQISPSQFVQRLAWGFLESPEATLGHLAHVAHVAHAAHAAGALVTPQALRQRFSARSVALLRGVLQDALCLLLEAAPVEVALLRAFPGGVYLDDSTQIALPAVWQTVWDGGGTAAALKIPALFDLLRGALHVDLTPARQPDSVTRLANRTFPPGALVIEDLGYLEAERLRRRTTQGVATSVPVRCTLALQDEQGQRINLLAWLRRPPHQPVERWVCWQGVGLRLVALPASPATAATAARKRQGIREAAERQGRVPPAAERQGRVPPAAALALAEWIVLLTTVPPEQATIEPIATLMRLRWQIERLFKLWKDQGKLDETRGWNPARLETELYAKRLGLLLAHWVLLATAWQWADRSLVKAGQTIREYGRCLCLSWRDLVHLTLVGDLIAQSLAHSGRIRSHCHHHSAAFYAQSA